MSVKSSCMQGFQYKIENSLPHKTFIHVIVSLIKESIFKFVGFFPSEVDSVGDVAIVKKIGFNIKGSE